MLDTPHITQSTAQHTACIHLTIPRAEMMHIFGPAIEELVATLSAQGMPPTGSAFAHHLKMRPDTFDFDVGFTTAAPVTSALAASNPVIGQRRRLHARFTMDHTKVSPLPGANSLPG